MVLAMVLELVQVLQQDLDPEGVEEVPHLLDLEVVVVVVVAVAAAVTAAGVAAVAGEAAGVAAGVAAAAAAGAESTPGRA